MLDATSARMVPGGGNDRPPTGIKLGGGISRTHNPQHHREHQDMARGATKMCEDRQTKIKIK